ncbi:MAG: SUMF1/EgtB/PvdO family nonheme iron enzyme [Bacteroidales bacterium]|nr:SUMF1/EgtB/PvdO family nonheme iron enzyme [Bacteroidales bacterium]
MLVVNNNICWIVLFVMFLGGLVKDKPPFKAKEDPPGTVWLRDSLYIDVAPVSNADYRNFLRFVQAAYSQKVKDTLRKIPSYGINIDKFMDYLKLMGPDKNFIKLMSIPLDIRLSWKMTMNQYFNSSLYDTYPVVFVTYSQAKEYCEWKTYMVMLSYAARSKNQRQRSKYYTQIKYRLPTVEEMSYALTKFKDNIFARYEVFADLETFTVPAYPQKKRRLEFVYFPRNVAEMTVEENIAFGLSWFDRDTTETYIKVVEYSRPSDWIGFRCVCEIVKY